MKRGFTLIELLAVIVILAIISLIAMPIVLNLIGDVREQSITRGIDLYLSNVEKAIVRYQIKNKNAKVGNVCKVQLNGNVICDNIQDEIKIDMKGDIPKCGLLTLNNGKIVKVDKLTLQEFEYNGTTRDKLKVTRIDPALACLVNIPVEEQEGEVESGYAYLKSKILLDNNVQSDENIDITNTNYYDSGYSIYINDNMEERDITGASCFASSYSFDENNGTFELFDCAGNYDGSHPYFYGEEGSSQICEITEETGEGRANVYTYSSIEDSIARNGNGLFANTNDGETTYFFRGMVENNYLKLGNNIFRIVRINEDGSIRIILNESIGDSVFNTMINDNAYVGYMYGTPKSSTYAATHANTNSSTIKIMLDNYYQTKLQQYSDYIADSGFCGDRSLSNNGDSVQLFDVVSPTSIPYINLDLSEMENITFTDTALGYGKNITFYGDGKTSFSCPNKNDLYTVSNDKGNKALTYPIGLLSYDEAIYAGAIRNRTNRYYYLFANSSWWTMSPGMFLQADLDDILDEQYTIYFLENPITQMDSNIQELMQYFFYIELGEEKTNSALDEISNSGSIDDLTFFGIMDMLPKKDQDNILNDFVTTKEIPQTEELMAIYNSFQEKGFVTTFAHMQEKEKKYFYNLFTKFLLEVVSRQTDSYNDYGLGTFINLTNGVAFDVAGVKGMQDDRVNANHSVRPVINLKKSVIWESGDGTISSPYEIKMGD